MNKKTLAFTIGLTILSLMSTNTKAVDQGTMDKLNKYPVVRKELKEFSRPITINLQKGDQVIRIDNKFKDGVRVLDGRTSIGVRDLVNAIEGAEVTWNQENKIVDIVKDGKNIAYPLNRMAMYDGNAIVTMDTIAGVDPKISRTFVPIRNLAESLGYEVDWDNATSTVTLRTPGSKPIAKPQENTQAQKPQATVGKGFNLKTFSADNNLYKVGDKVTLPSGLKVDAPWPGLAKEFGMGGSPAEFKPSEKDITRHGQYITLFKGTPYEVDLHAPFRKVNAYKRHKNFKIFEKCEDDRVGTYVYSRDLFGNMMGKSDTPLREPYQPNGFTNFIPMAAEGPIENVITSEMLAPKEEAKKFLREVDRQIAQKVELDKEYSTADSYETGKRANFGNVYDLTGFVDGQVISQVSSWTITGSYSYTSVRTQLFRPDWYILNNGQLIHWTRANKGDVIDKIIYRTVGSPFYWYIIDIPDLELKSDHRVICMRVTERYGDLQ